MYYWFRSPGQNLWEAFNTPALILPYIEEPQGEAVGWATDARGYYTISEEAGGVPAHLYYYPRIDDPFFFKVISLNVLIEGFYNGLSSISDTVTAELRNSSSPYAMIEKSKIVLDSSGYGSGKFSNTLNLIPYFLVIKHRNAIETWSAATQQFNLGALSYEFTAAQNKAFGNNMVKEGTKWCIYSGDVNQDDFIDGSDVALCFNDAVIGQSGYLVTDLTGDDFVDGTDVTIAFNNSNLGIGASYPSK